MKKVKLGVLAAVVAAAVMVPLYGDAQQASLTHADWARMMLGALQLQPIGRTHTPAESFALLSGTSSLAFPADLYHDGKGIRLAKEQNGQRVMAIGDVGEVVFPLSVVNPGNYRFRMQAAGATQPSSLEITPVGQSQPVGAFQVQPAAQMAWSEVGIAHLNPGMYQTSVLLPRGSALSQVEVAPPCVNSIEPIGGWKTEAQLEADDLAVTTLKAIRGEFDLPPANLPMEFPAELFQTSGNKIPGQSGVMAGPQGSQATLFIDVREGGLHAISVLGVRGGGQGWLVDSCHKAILCSDNGAGIAWHDVMVTSLTPGRHSFTVNLGAGAVIQRVRVERKKTSGADYRATLARRGFDVGAPGTVSRMRAQEAARFIRLAPLSAASSYCADIPAPQNLVATGAEPAGPVRGPATAPNSSGAPASVVNPPGPPAVPGQSGATPADPGVSPATPPTPPPLDPQSEATPVTP